MIDKIVDKSHCTGCMTCMQICPVKAIRSEECPDGFWYPLVDYKQCIGCRQCEKICPVNNSKEVINRNKKKNLKPEAYVAYNKDIQIRLKSSSGGIFSALANIVINKGGVVYGAAFNQTYMVYHTGVDNKEDIFKLQGSKYVQSRCSEVYREVKQYLLENRIVMFVGTSCQIEGVRAYLKYDPDNLLCVDLICLGIPSPGIWKRYLNRFMKPKQLEGLNFKSKKYGWERFSIEKKYPKRTKYSIGIFNLYMQGFFKRLYVRESCFICPFKNLNRGSDITLADSWGIETFAADMNDNKGCSTVLIHTGKGKRLFQETDNKYLISRSISIDDALKFNPNAVTCAEYNPKRNLFMWLVGHNLFTFGMVSMCNNFKEQISFFMKKCLKKIIGRGY